MKTGLPLIIGAAMGSMMLWLAHDHIVAGQFSGAAVLFVAAHAAVAVGIVLILRLTGLRWPAHWHRPDLRHMAVMGFAAGLTALSIHLIHGGPA